MPCAAQNESSKQRVSAYLSLGSNLGDRVANLSRAVSELRALGSVTAISSLYETEPMELKDQPWFLNCAVALETSLPADEVLRAVLKVEEGMARLRLVAKGPRTIDIDLLLYADFVIVTPELTVPHPAMHERRFVLLPLAEIASEVQHPVLKRSVGELSVALTESAGAVRRVQENSWPPLP